MSIRFEEIRDLLQEKIGKEKKRLIHNGYKPSSYDLADSIARYVEAMMTGSRVSELKRLKKVLDKQPSQGDLGKIWKHYRERLKATTSMVKALSNLAEEQEGKRIWKKKKLVTR